MINIVGGAGFIGTQLSRLMFLDGIINFRIVDKNISSCFPDKAVVADICSLKDLRETLVDNSILINLAAEHRDDVFPKSLYQEVNVGGAINICTVAREKNINKIIFTSSVAVYGFAPIGTSESGTIAPFNEYGRTKWEAEQIYKKWQEEDPLNRTLVIIRPTVVFGEGNRGNVFNLLKQIASGKFIMVGNGLNRKSLAYVNNVAAFLKFSLNFAPGVYIYNYIDKPDFTMNMLISLVNKLLGRSVKIRIRLPVYIGLFIGYSFDLFSKIFGINFTISSIRVKKFCANSIYVSSIESTGFVPPVPLLEGVANTVRYEFIEDHSLNQVFYSE